MKITLPPDFTTKNLWRWLILSSLSTAPRSGEELLRTVRQSSTAQDELSIFLIIEALLEDGTVRFASVGHSKAYVLTDHGRETFAAEPFASTYEYIYRRHLEGAATNAELEENQLRLRMALEYVARRGNEAQRREASEIALRACKELYEIPIQRFD